MTSPSVPSFRTRALAVPGLGGLAIGLACTVVVLLWVGGDAYRETLIITTVTYALVALGIYVPYVMSGSLSMAYAAYAAIGGYAVGLISRETDLPLWTAWVLGPIVAAILAVLLGMVTKRLSGFFLAAVTLLFGLAFAGFLKDAEGLTGGAGGLGQLRKLNLLGWRPDAYQLMVVSAVAVCLVAFLLDRTRLSPWGVTVRTMREAPRAVEAAGVRVPTMNLVALGLGAAIAATGGAVFTYSVGSVTPDTFKLDLVFLAIFMPLLGGSGTPWGAVLGAVIAVWLTLNFEIPDVELSGTLILAVGVLVVLLVAPKGVIGYLDKLRKGIREGWAAVADTLLTGSGLTKRYGGVTALEDVSLTLRAGEILGLVGPNGAGKTTLVDLISGAQPATAGELLLQGKRLSGPASRRAQLGLARTFQYPQLAHDLTARDNMLVGRTARRHATVPKMVASAFVGMFRPYSRTDHEALEAIAAELGIDRIDRHAGDLTLGEQRLVEVGRALTQDPLVLLLDEPFAGSDAHGVAGIIEVIRTVQRRGHGVILVDHNVDLVAGLVDRIMLLDRGRTVFDGGPKECLASPEMQRVYFGVAAASSTDSSTDSSTVEADDVRA